MRVSAGLCFEGERIWIFRRGAGRRNAHLWEFPGGKEEPGETPAECLRRELREELSLEIADEEVVAETDWEGIHFTFLRCRVLNAPRLSEHEGSALVTPRELLDYGFCPADAPVARALALNDPPLTDFFWDFDGTVMDTYPETVVCLCHTFSLYGIQADPVQVLSLLKASLRRCVEFYAAQAGVSEEEMTAAFRREEKNISPVNAPPLPGIPEALKALKARGARHYLVTHRDALARESLRCQGLAPLFTDMITAEDGFPRKPAPDSLLHLVQRYGLDPARCVMIGDRPLDVEAGWNAGMLGCFLDPEGRFADHPCPLRADHASKLPELLAPEPLMPRR